MDFSGPDLLTKKDSELFSRFVWSTQKGDEPFPIAYWGPHGNGLAALGLYMSGRFQLPPAVWQAWDFVISFAVVTGLFAMIFKLLPNVRLRWRDVWLGAVTTSLLFTLGKFVIGYYLATSSIASSFGAAGSVVIVLAWIYYSACILFFGAEITKGYARKFGSGIEPNSRAVLIDDLLRARLGLTSATIEAASTPPAVSPQPGETLPKE